MNPPRKFFFDYSNGMRMIEFHDDYLQLVDEPKTASNHPEIIRTKLEQSSLLPVLFRKSEFGAYAPPFLIAGIIGLGLAVILFIYTGEWFFKYYILASLVIGSARLLYSGFKLLKRTEMFLIADSKKPLNYSVDITNKSKKEQADFEAYYNTWMGNTTDRTFDIFLTLELNRYGKLYIRNDELTYIKISETKYPEIVEYKHAEISEVLAHRKLFAPFLTKIYIKVVINFALTAASIILLPGWYKLISILPLSFTLFGLQSAFRRFRHYEFISIRKRNGELAIVIDASNWTDAEKDDFENYYRDWMREP